MRTLCVIPARLHSTRLPRKVLQPLGGKPLLWFAWHHAQACDLLDEVVIATDSEEVAQVAQGFGAAVERTRPDHPSGSDRVAEVAERRDAEVIVNLQADEPFLEAKHLERLVQHMRETADPVATLASEIGHPEVRDPAVVKVVTAPDGRALYFSRTPIPFYRDTKGRYWKHLGVYAYRRGVLLEFVRWPPSPLERAEKLEQLRFLENNVLVRVLPVEGTFFSVDTEEDLWRAETWLRLQGYPYN